MPFPHPWFEALAARLAGQPGEAERQFRLARIRAAERLLESPEDPHKLMVVALIEAGLGQKESAVRQARAACATIPLERDAIDGAQLLFQFAVVCTWAGEHDEALRVLNRIALVPSPLTYGLLKLHPKWDSLRADPRFQALLASMTK